jgi:tetratricopeptide (TPR) repeat protein
MDWFMAEHQVILAAITLAETAGADRHAWQLPCLMAEYLARRGNMGERISIMAPALAAATRLGDLRGQALSRLRLGAANLRTGDYAEALAHLELSLPLFRQTGERGGEAAAEHNLAMLANVQERYGDGLGHSEQALRLYQATGEQAGQAEALNAIAWFETRLGRYQQALRHGEESLAIIEGLAGCERLHVAALDTLGYIELHLGTYDQAAGRFETALGLARAQGRRIEEAEALIHLGDARRASGDLERARQALQEALAISDDIPLSLAAEARAKLADMAA